MEERQKKEPLIILTGPTAVGKTALSLKLAQKLQGEIISADSMQVYRHMDIGSAKILPSEMQGIPHHLIDVLEPEEEFNVVTFQKMAKQAISDIRSRGKIPIITGGTGFFLFFTSSRSCMILTLRKIRRMTPAAGRLSRLRRKKGRNIFTKCWRPWTGKQRSRYMPTM